MGKTLFIGNGINRLTNSTAWKDVLTNLAKFAGEDESILDEELLKEKPFTLVFEEVFLRSARQRHMTELELKKETARLIDEMPHTDFHTRIMKTGVKHILTTNYDYNLEKGSGNTCSDASIPSEQKYSLYRRRKVGDQSVWHIHGETSAPDSLALGHNHYAGSLHHIRDYLVTRSTRVQRKISPYLDGDPDFDCGTHQYSWLDIFLRDDIHIYGFELYYSEIDLWWLLSFKERERLRNVTQSFGQTYFYYLDNPCLDNPRAEIQGAAKLAILQSFGVILVPLRAYTYVDAFNHFIGLFKPTSDQVAI